MQRLYFQCDPEDSIDNWPDERIWAELAARLAGFRANDKQLAQGIQWLRTHQRESGRWFTRSLNKDGRSFLTHAGTAFALRVLHDTSDR